MREHNLLVSHMHTNSKNRVTHAQRFNAAMRLKCLTATKIIKNSTNLREITLGGVSKAIGGMMFRDIGVIDGAV